MQRMPQEEYVDNKNKYKKQEEFNYEKMDLHSLRLCS
jgi:hypothetical protein